jgi:RimJ/RimL family protein N-acetyltransferase
MIKGEVKLVSLSIFSFTQYTKWFNDNDVVRYLSPFIPKKSSLILKWILLTIITKTKKYNSIYYKNINIGHTGLSVLPKNKYSAEVSIVIGDRNYWHKSLGEICLVETIRLARKIGIEQLLARVHAKNINSKKLFKKMGFVKGSEITIWNQVVFEHWTKRI